MLSWILFIPKSGRQVQIRNMKGNQWVTITLLPPTNMR